MSINTMEVYIQCMLCGHTATQYDYHENTSSDRSELFQVLDRRTAYRCEKCGQEWDFDVLCANGFCSVEDKDDYKQMLWRKLRQPGKYIFFSDWDADFFGTPRITEQPALDRLILMYPGDEEFKRLRDAYRLVRTCGKASVNKLETGEELVTRRQIRYPECLNKVYLREGVKAIGKGAFRDCDCLEDIFLPDSLERIGDEAFAGSGLRTVRTSDSLAIIGRRAFSGCKALRKLFLPAQLREIGELCFENCTGLQQLYIPDQTIIGRDAFKGCTGLTKIELPGPLKPLGAACFGLTEHTEVIWR